MSDSVLVLSGSLSAALRSCRERPDRRFLQTADGAGFRDVSRATLTDRAARLGALFRARGWKSGDRILVATRSDTAVAALVLACLEEGPTAVVVDPAATPTEAGLFIDQARPVAAFLDPSARQAWPVESVAAFTVDESRSQGGQLFSRLLRRSQPVAADVYPSLLEAVSPRSDIPNLPDEQEAYVLFTSGSTAQPRGVRLSRKSVLAHARTFERQFGYGPDDRVMNVLPLHHADGMVQGLLVPWLTGTEVIRPLTFAVTRIPDFFDALYRERVTHVVAVPTILSLLADHAGRDDDLRSAGVRVVISAAGFLSEALWNRFQNRFQLRVTNIYGLTETVTGGCFCGPDDVSHRLGTVGRPVDCEARLIDEQGRDIGTTGEGELCLRGDLVMMGYLADELGAASPFADGWLRTGDIATIDAEGFVRILGRRKNIVIVAGTNVQPAEVSECLEALAGVEAAVAFGLPDPVFGEVLVACVTPRDGIDLDISALLAGCRSRLSAHKVPADIAVVRGLPRGPSGKIVVPRAREMYLAQRASQVNESTDIHEGVYALAAEALRVPRGSLSPDAAPGITVGWDSFAHLLLVTKLESRFLIRLEPREIMGIRRLADAERIVREKHRG